MTLAHELAALFRRDLTRLLQELDAISNPEHLWREVPGISNTIGTLVLHLEGNLREYAGRQLGSVPYQRNRPAEFSQRGLPVEELRKRVLELRDLVPAVLAALPEEAFGQRYPEDVLGGPISTRQFLVHLYGHLNYHLGQIDYLRRTLDEGSAVPFAGL